MSKSLSSEGETLHFVVSFGRAEDYRLAICLTLNICKIKSQLLHIFTSSHGPDISWLIRSLVVVADAQYRNWTVAKHLFRGGPEKHVREIATSLRTHDD